MFNVVFHSSIYYSDRASEYYPETFIEAPGILAGSRVIKNFNTSLPNLRNGILFFQQSNIETFKGSLYALQTAKEMFKGCGLLISVETELPVLAEANSMFISCAKLPKFDIELPRLSDGTSMFNGCSSLTSFTSALPSLTTGTNMFSGCKLDARSLMYIVETLPTAETPANITIGLGVNSEDEMEEFAKAASFNSWGELKQLFIDKNWTATFQYNGAPTTAATLDENGQTTGAPIYARLIEADEDTGNYISEEDGKFYNLEWGHSITNSANYTVFGSLLEAYGYFGIVPKEFATE